MIKILKLTIWVVVLVLMISFWTYPDQIAEYMYNTRYAYEDYMDQGYNLSPGQMIEYLFYKYWISIGLSSTLLLITVIITGFNFIKILLLKRVMI